MSDSNKDSRTKAQLLEENEQLRRQFEEAEQALEAIRSGDVDALVVTGPQGAQVFSLSGVEHVYRMIVETMHEAALMVDPGWDDPVLQPALLRSDEDYDPGRDGSQSNGLRRPAAAVPPEGALGARPSPPGTAAADAAGLGRHGRAGPSLRQPAPNGQSPQHLPGGVRSDRVGGIGQLDPRPAGT